MDIVPLHPFFGAEIRGVDTSKPLDAATISAVQAAFDKYAVVLFRDQTLDNDKQAAFARQFGTPELYTVAYREDSNLRFKNPEMVDVGNIDPETGKVEGRDARHRLLTLSARFWHADSSFRLPVGALSMLYAHAIPPWGGETEFADMRAAYDALPDVRKTELNNLVAVHSMVQGYQMLGFTDFEERESEVLPPVDQPVVRVHPNSGRRALYLGWTLRGIRGMTVPDSRVLATELTEFATQRRFVLAHT